MRYLKKIEAKSKRHWDLIIETKSGKSFTFNLSEDESALGIPLHYWYENTYGGQYNEKGFEFDEKSKTGTVSLIDFIKYWRPSKIEKIFNQLKSSNKAAYNKLLPYAESEGPASHERFIKSMSEKHTGASEKSGLKPVTMRLSHKNIILYVPEDASLMWESFSLSDLEKWKPDGRKMVDALLSVKDKKVHKANAKALSYMVTGSMSEKSNTVRAYISQRLDALGF